MSKDVTTNQTYETYNYNILWGTARRNLDNAQNSANQDSMFWALGSMILTYCAFEGYLNWLGANIDPAAWENERKFFSNRPYQGTIGKYVYLSKILCLPAPDFSREPFQTVTTLKKLRNISVHPKIEKGTRKVISKKEDFPAPYKSALEKNVSPKKAKKAFRHVEKLCSELHRKSKALHPNLIIGQKPFDRILGCESGDVS